MVYNSRVGDYVSGREAARLSGYSYRYFRNLLNNGEVPGAFKDEATNRWRVPVNAGVPRERARVDERLEHEVARRLFLEKRAPKAVARDLGISVPTVHKIKNRLLIKNPRMVDDLERASRDSGLSAVQLRGGAVIQAVTDEDYETARSVLGELPVCPDLRNDRNVLYVRESELERQAYRNPTLRTTR